LPLLSGAGAPRQAAFSELAGFRNQGNSFAMVATDRYRYTYDRQNDLACELFDLDHDPDELENLVDDPDAAELRERLHQDTLVPFLEDRSPLA
jgi:arylsulfatase A-like enzyme